MREFETLRECIEYNHSTLILDLRNYLGPCGNPAYSELFKPSPKGIYVKGEISPLVDLEKPHYLLPSGKKFNVELLFTLERVNGIDDIKDKKVDLIDDKGNVKLNMVDIVRRYHLLTDDPGVSYQGVRAAAYFAISFLSRWCKYANVSVPYHYQDIFKEDVWGLVEDESLDVFKQLKYAISSFVGDDDLFLYFYRMKDSILHIQKNMDYRVYDYYVRKFNDE